MRTVYIVDDDASVRGATELLMTSAGIEARTFESGEAFLFADPSCEQACLIADMRMPDLTGLQLQQKLKERGRDIPIIFVTAHDTGEVRAQARAAGASGYFRKPVDEQALFDAIEWALSKKKSTGGTGELGSMNEQGQALGEGELR